MRRINLVLLWVFVFTTPWDAVPLPLVGSLSRAAGALLLGTTVVAVLSEGRIRKPDWLFASLIAFTAWIVLSLLWTISYGDTFTRAWSTVQLVAIVGIMRQFARTPEEQESLFVAFCLGSFVPMVSLLYNFMHDIQISMASRFSSSQVNADDLSLTLVIGVPMAWYLILQQRRGFARIVAVSFFILAPLATLLTGTRGAFLAGLVALSIVPLSLRGRLLFSQWARVAVFLAVIIGVSVAVVPQANWTRIMSISDELLGGGRLTGRRAIWTAGLQVFPDHVFVGVGAGAYGPAVQKYLNIGNTAAHNLVINLLVESGIIGVGLFGIVLGACAFTIARLPSRERTLWAVVMLTWLVGVMSVNWEIRKTTWLLFGFVAANGATGLVQRRTAQRAAVTASVAQRAPAVSVTAPALRNRFKPSDMSARDRYLRATTQQQR